MAITFPPSSAKRSGALPPPSSSPSPSSSGFSFSPLRSLLKFSVVVIIIIVFIIFDGIVLVPSGHAAVIFDYGRGVLENERGEGIHLKVPLWQKASVFDLRTQEYTMSIAAEEGSRYGDDSVEARSKDGQVVWVDATVLYHLEKDNANKILQTLGREADMIQKVVRPKTREVMRDVVSRFNSLDLVSEKRTEISDLMNKELAASFQVNFISFDDLLIRNVTFSPEFAQAIEQKEIARQNVITAQYRKEEALQFKEKKIIEAEAEAESIRLKGETLRSNPEVIQLEFVQKIADDIKWGVLPDNILPLMNFGQ